MGSRRRPKLPIRKATAPVEVTPNAMAGYEEHVFAGRWTRDFMCMTSPGNTGDLERRTAVADVTAFGPATPTFTSHG